MVSITSNYLTVFTFYYIVCFFSVFVYYSNIFSITVLIAIEAFILYSSSGSDSIELHSGCCAAVVLSVMRDQYGDFRGG